MRIEPTELRLSARPTGFEDRGRHQPCKARQGLHSRVEATWPAHGTCSWRYAAGTAHPGDPLMTRRPPLPIYLQTPRGELRGEVRLVERYRMTFELAAPLRPGDAVDFRLLLQPMRSGPDGTGGPEVRGTLRVTRILDSHPGAPSHFSAEVVEIRVGDLPELEAWLARHSSPQGRRFEAVDGTDSKAPMVDISDPGVELTDSYDPADLPETRAEVTETSGLPYGLTQPSEPRELRLAGREAIRAALRRGLQGRGPKGADTGARRAPRDAWLGQSRERARRQSRAWLEPHAVPEAATEGPEPSIHLDATTVGLLCITVRWRTVSRFQEDWARHLNGGGIFIPTEAPVGRDRAVELVLLLPSGAELRCAASVVAPMPTGIGLSLRLTPAQRARLEEEG